MLAQVLRISVALFVIMDPFGSIPLFLLATKEAKKADKAATYAVGVAAAVLFFFLFLGNPLFQALGIELTSLRMGGGIVLAVLAMELILGRGFTKMIPKGSPALLDRYSHAHRSRRYSLYHDLRSKLWVSAHSAGIHTRANLELDCPAPLALHPPSGG